jgi:hypothetical protein
MKLIAVYKEHESIKAVYCPVCFVVLKLNDRFKDYKTVETDPCGSLTYCFNCLDNKGPKTKSDSDFPDLVIKFKK